MRIVETAKHFIDKYYPQDHLYVAGGLAVLLLVFLAWPGDNGSTVPDQAQISIPVALGPGNAPITPDASATPDAETSGEILSYDPDDFIVPGETAASLLANEIVSLEDDSWQNVVVKSGDNLSVIFSKVGLSDQDLFRVLNSSEEANILNRLYPGYELDFMIPEAGELEQLRVLKSPLEGFIFKRSESGYAVETILKEAELQQAFRVGTIADSLFMAGQRENIPAVHIMEMANIFGGVMDFILDPRAGDEFSILYEEKYLDGEYIGPVKSWPLNILTKEKFSLRSDTSTRKAKQATTHPTVKVCARHSCAARWMYSALAPTLIQAAVTQYSTQSGPIKVLTTRRPRARRCGPPVTVR